MGLLISTLSSEGFVVQDEEENNSPGFQIVQMAWLTVHTLPQRILTQSNLCSTLGAVSLLKYVISVLGVFVALV